MIEQTISSEDWIGLYQGEFDLNNSVVNLKYTFYVKNVTNGWLTSDIKFQEPITHDFKKPTVLKWRAVYWTKKQNYSDHGILILFFKLFYTHINQSYLRFNLIGIKKKIRKHNKYLQYFFPDKTKDLTEFKNAINKSN